MLHNSVHKMAAGPTHHQGSSIRLALRRRSALVLGPTAPRGTASRHPRTTCLPACLPACSRLDSLRISSVPDQHLKTIDQRIPCTHRMDALYTFGPGGLCATWCASTPQSIVLGASRDSAKRHICAFMPLCRFLLADRRQARAKSTSSPGEPAAVWRSTEAPAFDGSAKAWS
jgi:hypothetical protein